MVLCLLCLCICPCPYRCHFAVTSPPLLLPLPLVFYPFMPLPLPLPMPLSLSLPMSLSLPLPLSPISSPPYHHLIIHLHDVSETRTPTAVSLLLTHTPKYSYTVEPDARKTRSSMPTRLVYMNTHDTISLCIHVAILSSLTLVLPTRDLENALCVGM